MQSSVQFAHQIKKWIPTKVHKSVTDFAASKFLKLTKSRYTNAVVYLLMNDISADELEEFSGRQHRKMKNVSKQSIIWEIIWSRSGHYVHKKLASQIFLSSISVKILQFAMLISLFFT